jgi:hypothetical protein
MEVNFGRYFIINLELSESELHDLLIELEELSKNESEKYETLIKFRKAIINAIEYQKGMHLIETE